MTLYVKLSAPLYPVARVYEKLPSAFSVNVPCAGCVTGGRATDSGSPFASVSLASTPGAATTDEAAVSMTYASLFAIGASFGVAPAISIVTSFNDTV